MERNRAADRNRRATTSKRNDVNSSWVPLEERPNRKCRSRDLTLALNLKATKEHMKRENEIAKEVSSVPTDRITGNSRQARDGWEKELDTGNTRAMQLTTTTKM